MWETRIICFILLVLSGVFASYYGGIIPYSLFYFFLMLPVVSLLYTLYVYRKFRIYQTVEKKTLVKQEVSDYQYQIVNEDWINFESIRVNFFDDYSTILESDNKESFCLLPGENISRSTKICCHYRGRYRVGIKSVEIQDFLHLFSINYPLLTQYHVIVMPRLLEVEKLCFLAKNQDAKIVRGLVNGEETERSSEVRTFLPGDDKRLIHWKASAKTNELLVRKIEAVPKPELTMFLDTSSNKSSENYKIYDQLIECALAILSYSIKKEQVGCRLIYHQQGKMDVTLNNVVQLEDFYQKTADLSFREQTSFLEHFREEVGHGEMKGEVVVVTQKLEKDYLVYGAECIKMGISLSIICVEELPEENKELVSLLEETGVSVVVAPPSCDLKSVLEEGVEA